MQAYVNHVTVPVPCHHGALDTSASEHWTACAHMPPSADWLHLLCLSHMGQRLHQDHHGTLAHHEQ